MKLERCFIKVLLSLTLNSTPASLGSNCYLGTLNWKIKNWMEVFWMNMFDFYLFLISKKNQFHDRFSFTWELEVGSQSGFHM
jgi:hypothetical protein